MIDPDMRPASGLFLTLYGALKRQRETENSLRELAKGCKNGRVSLELVNCFDPANYRFSVFDITLYYWLNEQIGEPICLFTIRDEGQGNQMNVITLDISNPDAKLEDLFTSLLFILASHYPDTLTRIAESENDILEKLRWGEEYVLAGKPRFKIKEQALYRDLVLPLLPPTECE